MSHQLDRLELEIHTEDEALARQLLARLSQLHHQSLEEVLERVLDQLSPPGSLHRLESLEIDLGEIPADQLERQLPERLEQALREMLAPRLRLAQPSGFPETPHQAPTSDALPANSDTLPTNQPTSRPDPQPHAPSLPTHPSPQNTSLPVPRLSPLDPSLPRHLELLAFYAATGSLPPWAPTDDPRLIPDALQTLLALPNGQAPSLTRQVNPPPQPISDALPTNQPTSRPEPQPHAPSLPTHPSAQDPSLPRHLELLAFYAATGSLPPWAPTDDPRLIPDALQTLLALPNGQAPSLTRQVNPPPQPTSDTLPTNQPTSRPVPQPHAPSLPTHPSPQNTSLPVPRLSPLDPSLPRHLELLAFYAATGSLPPWAPTDDPRLIPDALQTLLALPNGQAPSLTRQVNPPPQPTSDTLPTNQPTSRPVPQPHAPSLPTHPSPQNTSLPVPRLSPLDPSLHSPEEAIRVDGAGLVMLWPFLETLFERLGWLTAERRFGSTTEQERAVALLGFLVDGEPQPPDWRLPLAKLLCGVAPETCCALEEALSMSEQAEAEGLLEATLAHGKGLLEEGMEPLREKVLQRPGLLTWRPGAWLLVVERREEDELLRQLPWSWAWIRLPWMAALLQVVW